MVHIKSGRGRGRPKKPIDKTFGEEVKIRVAAHLLKRVDMLAAEHGYNRSEAIRDLLTSAISVMDLGAPARAAQAAAAAKRAETEARKEARRAKRQQGK
jgi:metal-responsive CopG/Arc/MetJ family transcriptional regulator